MAGPENGFEGFIRCVIEQGLPQFLQRLAKVVRRRSFQHSAAQLAGFFVGKQRNSSCRGSAGEALLRRNQTSPGSLKRGTNAAWMK
jgi:hypothetical protein